MKLLLGIRCICSNIRRGLPGAAIVVVLLVLISFAALYANVQWQAYYSIAQRDRQSISWSLECNFTDGSKKTIEAFERTAKSLYPESRLAVCASSDALLRSDVPDSPELNVSVRFVHHGADDNIRLLDFASSSQFVTEGNPDDSAGVVLDAMTAKKLGLHAGDCCTVGFKDLPSAGSPSFRVSYQKVKIAALFAPDDNYSGMVMYRPEGNIRASVRESGDYATDLYVFGLDDRGAASCAASLERTFGEEKASFFTRGGEVESAEEQIAYNNTGEGFARSIRLFSILAVFVISLLDSVRKSRGRSRGFATLSLCGARRRIVLTAAFVVDLFSFLLIWLASFAVAVSATELCSNIWVPPDVYVYSGLVLALVLAMGLALESGYMVYSLRPAGLLRLLRSLEAR